MKPDCASIRDCSSALARALCKPPGVWDGSELEEGQCPDRSQENYNYWTPPPRPIRQGQSKEPVRAVSIRLRFRISILEAVDPEALSAR